jgi:hypothetical protein
MDGHGTLLIITREPESPVKHYTILTDSNVNRQKQLTAQPHICNRNKTSAAVGPGKFYINTRLPV